MNSIMTETQSISASGPARSTINGSPLQPEELHRVKSYWTPPSSCRPG
jgi:hypothetical protein